MKISPQSTILSCLRREGNGREPSPENKVDAAPISLDGWNSTFFCTELSSSTSWNPANNVAQYSSDRLIKTRYLASPRKQWLWLYWLMVLSLPSLGHVRYVKPTVLTVLPFVACSDESKYHQQSGVAMETVLGWLIHVQIPLWRGDPIPRWANVALIAFDDVYHLNSFSNLYPAVGHGFCWSFLRWLLQ